MLMPNLLSDYVGYKLNLSISNLFWVANDGLQHRQKALGATACGETRRAVDPAVAAASLGSRDARATLSHARHGAAAARQRTGVASKFS